MCVSKEPTGLGDVLGGAQRQHSGDVFATEGGAHVELRDRRLSGRCLIWGGSRGRGWVVIQHTDRGEQIYAEFANLESFKGLFNEGKSKCTQK